MQKHYLNKLVAVLGFSFFCSYSLVAAPQEILADFTAQLIKKEQGPVVIFIYADYCGACNKAKEELPDVIKKCKNKVSFYQCNVQDPFGMGFLKNNSLLEKDVNSIPVFAIRNKGKLVHFQVGYPGKDKLIQMINQYS
jgi:thiol-disulfide isomerase/thioredoxin